MRLLFLISFLLFLNCENKQNKEIIINPKINNNNNNNTKTRDTLTSNLTIKKAVPKLNTKNSMSFFLEYNKLHKENKVRITTDFGSFDLFLFNETKFHRSNFIFLTKQGYFNNTQFYRVINNFIIQGGDSDDIKTAKKRQKIGKYLLPLDAKHGFKHHRGVISMPSSDIENPHKLASPYDFFIIQQQGGSHSLNGDYTVFGKVIRGMETIDKIAAVKTDNSDWPIKNVYIRSAEIIN